MKKTLLAITAVITALSLNAQDTLTEFFTGTVNFYTAQGGGYVTGNNAYGDLAKGMRYNSETGMTGGGTINSVLFSVPAKADAGSASLTVKIYAYSPTDTLGAELGSSTVLLSAIDTNAAGYSMAEGMPYNVTATFSPAVTVPGDIIVMVYLPTGTGNAIVIPSNTTGDFAFAGTHTFEIWNDGSIHDFASAWQGGVNVAMPIFLAGDLTLGIADNEMIQASAYPNPANDVLNIKAGEAITSVSVMTMDGKIVGTSSTTSVNVADLNAGMYMYEAVTVTGKVARGSFAKN
jgi:hypothetical protein